MLHWNHLKPNVPFLFPLKTSENLILIPLKTSKIPAFFYLFRGHRNEAFWRFQEVQKWSIWLKWVNNWGKTFNKGLSEIYIRKLFQQKRPLCKKIYVNLLKGCVVTTHAIKFRVCGCALMNKILGATGIILGDILFTLGKWLSFTLQWLSFTWCRPGEYISIFSDPSISS